MTEVNNSLEEKIATEQKLVPELKTTGKNKRDPFLDTIVADRYKLLSLLGRGATTSVYKAFDEELKRFVAVKILRNDSIFNEQTIRRFEQECKTLALLKHANIVQLYDSGVNDTDQPFLVMEFVDGLSLKDVIEAGNGVPVKRALDIFIQVCAALAAAHEKGVVHRDMKPANIMITKDADNREVVKVLDFGVAKLLVQGETFQTKTQTGEMLGTLLYMSPEQCLEQCLDARCDVYSVGCVLYETLTGKPPLVGRTAFETMNKHLTEMPEKLSKVRPDKSFAPRLDELLTITMAKDPEDRYQSIGQLQDALVAIRNRLDQFELLHPETESSDFTDEEAIQTQGTSVVEVNPNASTNPQVDVRILLIGPCCMLGLVSPIFWAVGLLFALSWLMTRFKNAPPAESSSEQLTMLDRGAVRKRTAQVLDDSSRSGTIYFLAMEAKDGVPWRTIYADRLLTDNITEAEVIAQKNRLIAAQSDAWKKVKSFALSSFDQLDTNKDGYIAKGELIAARSQSNPKLQNFALLSFLIENLDDILVTVKSRNSAGIRRADLSEYFLLLEEMAKTGA